jgi:hypothetical protein
LVNGKSNIIWLNELIMSRTFLNISFFSSVGTGGPMSSEKGSTARKQSTGATSPENSGESGHVITDGKI